MDEKLYLKAKKRVKKKKEFFSNLGSWIVMSLFFIGLNLYTSPGFLWCLFPIAGWGIGIAFHAFEVFGAPGFSKEWEKKAVKKELQRMKSEQENYDEDYLELDNYENEKLELKEFRELRQEWKDSDFV
ncbi:MAG: 2TM domain-containing protein [Bacteroidota bacterium]